MPEVQKVAKKSSRLLKFAILAAAGLLAFAWALGDFVAPPRLSDLAAAARQASGEAHSLHGQLALAIWKMGGATALAWARWGIEMLVAWGLCAGVLLIVRRWGSKVFWGTSLALVLLALGSIAFHIATWQDRRLDPRLSLPVSLLDAIPRETTEIFVNSSARSAIALLGTERGILPCSMEDGALASDVRSWRKRLREKLWSAAVLAGPTMEFRELLDHLLASADWRLAGISNLGWVFLRGGGVAESAQPPPEDFHSGESAIYSAQLAGRLAESHQMPEARKAIRKALDKAPRHPVVNWHAARFYAQLGEWNEAARHAQVALQRGSKEAAPLLARALLEKGDSDSARQVAHKAIRDFPRDPETYFLLARIERERKDGHAEAEALEGAVAAARKSGLPDTTYLAYLGQARAKLGDAPRAIAAYEEALARKNLRAEDRRVLEEALHIVRERSQGFSTP